MAQRVQECRNCAKRAAREIHGSDFALEHSLGGCQPYDKTQVQGMKFAKVPCSRNER